MMHALQTGLPGGQWGPALLPWHGTALIPQTSFEKEACLGADLDVLIIAREMACC